MRLTLTLLTCALLLTLPAVAQPPGPPGGGFDGGPGGFGGERGNGPGMRGPDGHGPSNHGPSNHGPGGFLSRRVAEYLELTDEQIAAAKQIKEDLRAEIEPLHEQAQTQHQALRDLLDTDNPDAATVGQLVIDSHATREQVRAAGDNAKAAFVALLTPEQLELWENLKNVRDSFGPGRGHFRGGPGAESGPRHRGPHGGGERFGGFGG